MKNQFEGWYSHQFRKEERDYSKKQSDAEELLGRLIQSGRVVVGSDEWRKRCEYIEQMADMASRLNTKYDEND
jgi:hypothetical protein